ncbi:Uncharacterised protein [Campylobacter gracilis]|nr:Uncharacterised protein [Campylobacter gracilis]
MDRRIGVNQNIIGHCNLEWYMLLSNEAKLTNLKPLF